MTLRILFVLLSLATLGASALRAQSPAGSAFSYQGLLSSGGLPLTGTADFRMTLFDAVEGGNVVGAMQPVNNVALTGGLFTVALNFGAAAFAGDARWLEIAVRSPAGSGTFQTLLPRQPLTAAPYAVYALAAPGDGTGPWQTAGSSIRYLAGNVGIGVSDPSSIFEVGSGTQRLAIDLDSDPAAVRLGSTVTAALGSRGSVEIALDTNDNDNDKTFRIVRDGYGAQPQAVELMRVEESGRIGMGIVDPGNSTVHIDAQGRPTGLRVDSSVNGGVVISANATGTSGNCVAGNFSTDSPAGTAVIAVANSAGGIAYGVRGVTNSTAAGAAGVRGDAPAGGNVNFGVYGQAIGGNAYGVYANGRLGASGTKAFMIDHPLDPENRLLLHYSAESPDVLNIYGGNVTLDGSGEAWVQLPDYFEAINVEPRYQLTAIGAPAPQLHVAERIKSNRFRIAGGPPGIEVSWEIKARRNDRFVARHGAEVEPMKSEADRGKYIDPTLFGQPAEKGMYHLPLPARTEATEPHDHPSR